MPVPRAVKVVAISAMKRMAMGKREMLWIRKSATKQTLITMSPCTRAVVAPPNVRPVMIEIRETGATSVSLRKPNCRSQIKSIPENMELKRTVIPITPGAINWM